tara:strand:- start:845 stop:1393 length:549 start_codon:yes stop_codon:yes gene_type:complete
MIPFIIGAIVILLICFHVTSEMSLRGKAKINIFTIYILGILLWPILWEKMLHDNAYTTASLPSLFWPMMILGLEIYLMKYHTLENESRSRKGMISMDASTVCTLTFALGSILGAHKNKCCQNLFIYGVLGTIAFVMPNPTVPSETLESIVIETIQKVFLTYSAALLLAGAMILQTGTVSTNP